MKCAWSQLLSVLPQHMRNEVDRQGRETLQELRLRLGEQVLLCTATGNRYIKVQTTADDIRFVVNAASRYSPWSAATAADGYITAPGGHRIGLCGQCVYHDGSVTAIRETTSLCIRVARDFPGLASGVPLDTSVLILGPPGSGKTTFLRDMIRRAGNCGAGAVSVVDERGEVFPREARFTMGSQVDVITGCDKKSGIEMVLRTMGPTYIAVDEITAEEDCRALLQAGWCGVRLFATAHAATLEDLRSRPVYRPLVRTNLFETAVILKPDKSWKMERMKL